MIKTFKKKDIKKIDESFYKALYNIWIKGDFDLLDFHHNLDNSFTISPKLFTSKKFALAILDQDKTLYNKII